MADESSYKSGSPAGARMIHKGSNGGSRTDVEATSAVRHCTSGRGLEAFWLHLCSPEIDGRQRHKGRRVGIQIRSHDTEPGISDYAGVACICRPHIGQEV
jgi:hypothetical protein